MSRVNETRFLVQHESCECRCGLNESVCNSNQKWIHNECRWEYKELNDSDFVKTIICGILIRVIVNVIRQVKLQNI